MRWEDGQVVLWHDAGLAIAISYLSKRFLTTFHCLRAVAVHAIGRLLNVERQSDVAESSLMRRRDRVEPGAGHSRQASAAISHQVDI